MPRLLVVHHTAFPTLQDMFDAVIGGATDPSIEGVEVITRPALVATALDVLEADGYILGTPANLGYTGRPIGRLDICWPDVGLWVELDGHAWHDTARALLYDRRRQNELAAALQWLPLRFTWDDVTERPDATARLTEIAYRRRARSAPR